MASRSAYVPFVGSPIPERGISQVLFVCRANRCRSPFAEEIARRIAGDRAVRFTSAGLLPGGEPMPRVGQAVARALDLDFAEHRSAELDIHSADGFDLILTMGRDQARDVIAENPDLRPRVFTLKQFARWIESHPVPANVALREWLDGQTEPRPNSDFIGVDPHDDVADPLTKPAEAWHRMVKDLSRYLIRAIDGITKEA